MNREIKPEWLTPAVTPTAKQWRDALYYGGLGYGAEERRKRIMDTGFCTHSQEIVMALVKLIGDRKVFEVGAGKGHLARLLYDQGVDIRAVDSRAGNSTRPEWWETPNYFDVEHLDATTLDELPGEVILMVWPCWRDKFAEDIARKIKPGQLLLYYGESEGGCTADAGFFKFIYSAMTEQELPEEFNTHSVTYHTLNDYWSAYTYPLQEVPNG